MVRIWQKPGVLMTAYLVLYLAAGPRPGGRFPSTARQLVSLPDPGSIALVVFLAWRVTRGGSVARGLAILGTAVGIASLLSSPGMRAGSLISLGLLTIYILQVALLVSEPVYLRTRKNAAAGGRPRLWAPPPGWMAVTAAAAGLIITLLYLGTMDWRNVPGCGSSGSPMTPSGPLAQAQCATLAEGYPVHYLSTEPSVSLNSGNTVTAANLSVSADPVISKGAAAEDLATWALISFTACYLLWVPSRRPATPAASGQPLPA